MSEDEQKEETQDAAEVEEVAEVEESEDYESFDLEDAAVYGEDEEDEDDTDEEEFDGSGFEERYRQRLEEQKEQKRRRIFNVIGIIGIILAIVALGVLFYFSDFGVIGTYKKNFEKNFRRIFPKMEQSIDIGVTEKNSNVQEYVDNTGETRVRSVERAENVHVVPFESAATGQFAAYRNGLICARTNYLCVLDGTGSVLWEKNTTVVDPLLSVAGQYIAIGAENGTKLCLYNGENLVFEKSTEDKIRDIRVSTGGDIVLVCDKVNYKGAISVYNKEGQEIFSWFSGQNNVISADISSASRRVAAVLLNADRKVYSIIKVFDISSKNDSVEMAFDDTILFDVSYTGDTITGLGDNSMVCMTSTGRVICDKRFDRVDISHCAYDMEGNKLIHFDSAGIPVFQLYGRKGVMDSEIIADHFADCLDVDGRYILYNNGRSVILRRAGSDRLNEYVATMDVLKLVLINQSTYAVIHSNSIEIVRV